MKYAIGIDLGGTFIKYAVVSEQGDFLFDGKLPSCADVSAEAVVGQLVAAGKSCQAFTLQEGIALEGVGIGTPGITDADGRVVLGGSDNIEGWINVPLADLLERELNLPVKANNDANLMGLGEQAYGAAKGCSDVLFITVGTGIGGAIIIDGKLYGGYQNRGTELGHIPLFMDGLPCSCGSVGCWEAYASTSAMVASFAAKAKEQGRSFEQEPDGKLIVELYHQGDALAVETIDQECRYLGRGMGSLINIFSPQKVVVGGGISESGTFFIDKTAAYALRYAMPDCSINTEVCAALLGNKAGVMGAAQLIFTSSGCD